MAMPSNPLETLRAMDEPLAQLQTLLAQLSGETNDPGAALLQPKLDAFVTAHHWFHNELYDKLVEHGSMAQELEARGWVLVCTGGNCNGWAWGDLGRLHLLLTERGESAAPQTRTAPLTVGVYTPDYTGHSVEIPDYDAFTHWAKRFSTPEEMAADIGYFGGAYEEVVKRLVAEGFKVDEGLFTQRLDILDDVIDVGGPVPNDDHTRVEVEYDSAIYRGMIPQEYPTIERFLAEYRRDAEAIARQQSGIDPTHVLMDFATDQGGWDEPVMLWARCACGWIAPHEQGTYDRKEAEAIWARHTQDVR